MHLAAGILMNCEAGPCGIAADGASAELGESHGQDQEAQGQGLLMARRKISGVDPEKQFHELPEITGNQLNFVRGILEGKTASDAYRGAYDCSNMQPNTIWAAASRLRSDAKVSVWLDASRIAELGQAGVTLDQHIRRLDALKSIAVKTGNVGAAVQAEQLIGKAMGHYVEKFEDVSRTDPNEILKELAKLAPDAARALAQQSGIQLEEATQH